VVLDKNPFLGGNSTKATSGINGALTKTQIKLGVPDSAETFYDDTAKSARDLIMPDLVKVLTGESASAVEWLKDRFNLDLSLVSRLGGHSFPRTHRGKEKFPGMTITYALMEKLEDLCQSEPNRARILKKARATRLIQGDKGEIVGVEYEMDGKVNQEFGPVILATGGYAADFTQDGFLKQFRPEYYDLPTTNGDHCTGDGIKMVKAIGGKNINMKQVQVHPTGLVDPKEPDAKVKFLAAEALRGVGGLLLDREGHRFVNELGHRDYVTGLMWKTNKPPYRLVLNKAAGKEIEWHVKHYIGRGLMKHFPNAEALAKEMGIPVKVLEETFREYNEIAKKKSDPHGKLYFQNCPINSNEEFFVSIVTPVLHYTMGGLNISDTAQVKSDSGAIPGLFAAGEVAGGVHGANRLGGSSLLGCVVFGRVAGDSASHYLLSSLVDPSTQQTTTKRVSSIAQHLSAPQISTSSSDLKLGATISQNDVQTRVEVEPHSNRFTMEISWGKDGNVSYAGPSTPSNVISSPNASTPSTSSSSTQPSSTPTPVDRNTEYTLEEVAKHNKEDDCWVVVNGTVLDVTRFLPDHPGGKKAILLYAGRDATEEFNMIHKPDVIEKYAPYTIIGKLKGSSSAKPASSSNGNPAVQLTPSNQESWNSGGTADILPNERKKATFDVVKLTNILDGGPEKTKRRHFILSPNVGMDVSDKHNWDVKKQLKEHVNHFMKVHEAFWDTFVPTREEVGWMMEYSMFSGSLMNHYGLFLPTIEMHASEEQRKWWSVRARSMKMIGCYAQTELGHGSNVRGLQTIAVYDKQSQQFVLNTPTLQSMKWWPGTLGKVATHALVYAQLIIDSKEYGVHSFMVQLRDENHKPLPGIELGDLGPKLGDHANDTGFMRMKDVRIPREALLARYQQVTPSGEYIKSEGKKKNAKLHYSTMIFTRGAMVKGAGGYLARAVTIATRYSCVRHQGFLEHKKSTTYKAAERPIIDYQMQRYRVFRQLAKTYAIKFTGTWMSQQFQGIEGKDRGLANIEALPEIAATSGGLKSLCTYLAWEGIEDLRKCCGGNGYLMSSGVAPLAANYVWQSTAEGDYILLMLHTSQFLLKTLSKAMEGKPLSGPVSYLAPLKDGFDPLTSKLPEGKGPEDYCNLKFLLKLFQACALHSVASVGQQFQQKVMELDGKFEEAFNSCAIELVNAVRSHCINFMLTNFVQAVEAIQDRPIREALTDLCALFACSNIVDDPQWTGLINAPQMRFVKIALDKLLNAVRPNAIALVDAFEIPDRVLQSAIGRYDGNVYEALYETALRSTLNQSDPFDGYEEYLRPHLDLEFLKQGNKVPSKM